MNLLIDSLPDFVLVEGRKYGINTDFRIWLEFDRTMRLENVSIKDKMQMASRLCFDKEKCRIFPENAGETMKSFLSFFLCGKEAQADSKKEAAEGRKEKAFCFSWDSDYIYSAFLTQYGIDLLSIPYMHWFVFSALFRGLEEDRRIMKIINWRLLDTDGIQNKDKKEYFKKMKEFYALPDKRTLREREEEIAEILSNAF